MIERPVENISDQLISSIYANYDITDNITLNISAGVEKIDFTNFHVFDIFFCFCLLVLPR